MMGSGMNLITTVIGFGMSAAFIVFVCTRIICGRFREAESRRMLEIESRIDVEQPEHQVIGVEPVLVSAIPTMKFNREAFSSIDDAQCSICLAEYQEKEVLRIMPKCGHSFHLACIDVWLRKQSTCPVCRLPIQQSYGTKHTRQVAANMAPSLDDSQISNDHSSQWLLPGSEQSSNISNQGHLEIGFGTLPENNSEPSQSREAETRAQGSD